MNPYELLLLQIFSQITDSPLSVFSLSNIKQNHLSNIHQIQSSVTLSLPLSLTHTHTHTHVDKDTHICTKTHTHIQAHTHIYPHTQTHTHTYTDAKHSDQDNVK